MGDCQHTRRCGLDEGHAGPCKPYCPICCNIHCCCDEGDWPIKAKLRVDYQSDEIASLRTRLAVAEKSRDEYYAEIEALHAELGEPYQCGAVSRLYKRIAEVEAARDEACDIATDLLFKHRPYPPPSAEAKASHDEGHMQLFRLRQAGRAK